MKVIMEFNLPDDSMLYEAANAAMEKATQNGYYYSDGKEALRALGDIHIELFRPLHKHGYQGVRLRELVESDPNADELISLLEEKYFEILESFELKGKV